MSTKKRKKSDEVDQKYFDKNNGNPKTVEKISSPKVSIFLVTSLKFPDSTLFPKISKH